MRLFLIRHGQTEWNASGKSQGQTDIPLDAIGLAQAAALEGAFRDVDLERIISSDLSRAKQTAEPISRVTGVQIELREDLRERSFGQWEGRSFNEIHKKMDDLARQQGITRLEIAPPQGESFADVWDRLDDFVEMLHQEQGAVAVVTHGGTASLLLARLVRGTLHTSRAFKFGNASITEVGRRDDGTYSIDRYNVQDHLDAPSGLGGIDGLGR